MHSPMMNNNYKNNICGCHVWLTFTAPSTMLLEQRKNSLPHPSPVFMDYPQYCDVSIVNHMFFLRNLG